MTKIKNAKILILATDGFEQSELEVPRDKLRNVARLVHVAAPKSRKDKKTITGYLSCAVAAHRSQRCAWPQNDVLSLHENRFDQRVRRLGRRGGGL